MCNNPGNCYLIIVSIVIYDNLAGMLAVPRHPSVLKRKERFGEGMLPVT
jgi:hypothetical protein